MISITEKLKVFDFELNWSFARSSGAGGQNVNKVNSKAVLKWNPLFSSGLTNDVKQRFLERYGSRIGEDGYITIQSERFRDQPQNSRDCIEKLKALILAVAHPPKIRKKTKPTKSSKQRRLTNKKLNSEKKRNRRLI